MPSHRQQDTRFLGSLHGRLATRVRGGAVVCLALLTVACGRDDTGASGSLDFPPPPPPAPQTVTRADFVGSEACASCHEKEYRAWSRSTHGTAGGAPGPDVVVAAFNGRPIRFADGTVTPRVRGGTYEFAVRQDGFAERTFVVDGVIGKGHMRGGGTQGFLTRMADGTDRFVPWDWSRTAGTWFCNTGSRLNQGWLPITPRMRLADCGDWPPVRPIGTVDRFANCQECHGSQIHTALDTVARAYDTEYTTLQVNCESCHGPAKRHVEMARSGTFGADGDIGLQSLAWRDKDASLRVCFRCHALKDVLREGYLPGDSLDLYYALKLPILGDRPYLADARVRTFAYQATHLASECYLQGPMDCVSCHEPHGQGYWDTDHKPLSSPYDDGQCTSCHASKGGTAADIEAHTHHPASSKGSRCVSCHMPYLQQPEVGPAIPYGRSDHTISIPRPVYDADEGITGACAQCHRDRSALQLQDEARAWWGELRPHRPLVQGQVDELKARNVTQAAALLIHPEENDPLIQFQALSRLLVGYLAPDDSTLADTVVQGLRSLTGSSDLDVRALALASLHWARGYDPTVRRDLVTALKSAPSDEALRSRWTLILGYLGDSNRDADHPRRAEAAYRKALELEPGDPKLLHAYGLLKSHTGDYTAAVDLFRRSLGADPAEPLGWVNLGIALAASGDAVGAEEAYRRALDLDPHEPLAHFNLGNVLQRAKDLEGAAKEYAAAVQADPGLGRAQFELARTYILLGRSADALPHARRAVEFMPEDAGSLAMLRDLEKAQGSR